MIFLRLVDTCNVFYDLFALHGGERVEPFGKESYTENICYSPLVSHQGPVVQKPIRPNPGLT